MSKFEFDGDSAKFTLNPNDEQGSAKVKELLNQWSLLCQDQIAEECFKKMDQPCQPPPKKYKHIPAKDLAPKGMSYVDDRTYNCQVIRGKKPVFKQ